MKRDFVGARSPFVARIKLTSFTGPFVSATMPFAVSFMNGSKRLMASKRPRKRRRLLA
jgi:hypothetical protein